MTTIDLNSDLGESFGRYTLGMDAEVIPLVSSVNVACGMHAGDPVVMRRTVQAAAAAGVSVGAHPGYPDLQGFGRRDMALSPDEAYSFVLYQIGALDAFCKAAGVRLRHVKPHGQLYNRAAVDRPLADAIAAAVKDFGKGLVLVGLANGALVEAGDQAGVPVAREFFADRAYTDEGRLVPRSQDNAVITDEDFAIARVVEAVRTQSVVTESGKRIDLPFDTVCVHGDSPRALDFVRRIRAALAAEDVQVAPVGGARGRSRN